MDSSTMRRNFAAGLLIGLRAVWPILSVLLGAIVVLDLVVGFLEGWSVQESIYFAFVSGLTIGYGDFAPKTLLTRTLAVLIGVCGVLVTALVAAVAVKALTLIREYGDVMMPEQILFDGAGRSVWQRAVPERAQLHRFQIFYMALLTTPKPALQQSGA